MEARSNRGLLLIPVPTINLYDLGPTMETKITTLPLLRELDLYELHIHQIAPDQYKVSGYDLLITYTDMGNTSSFI